MRISSFLALLTSCLLLSSKLAANSDSGFMLVCKFDGSDEQETLQMLGHGQYIDLDGMRETLENHYEDRIVQHVWAIDPDTGERINLGSEAEPKFLSYSHTINRYTGRIQYFDDSVGLREGSCRRAEEPLF